MRLSKSSIQTYLSCPKAYILRKEYGDSSKKLIEEGQSIDSRIGLEIHRLIETYRDDLSYWENVEAVSSCLRDDGISKDKLNKFITCAKNFLNYKQYVGRDDLIEYPFEVEINGIEFIGRFDRVHDDIIIDWKTSKVQNNIDNDIQCIIYEQAYKKIFKKQPRVILVSLLQDKEVAFQHTKFSNIFFSDIVPYVYNGIKENNFPRKGAFNGACYLCAYQTECGL